MKMMFIYSSIVNLLYHKLTHTVNSVVPNSGYYLATQRKYVIITYIHSNKKGGLFIDKGEEGANHFVGIHLILDTTIKNGRDVFYALEYLDKGKRHLRNF